MELDVCAGDVVFCGAYGTLYVCWIDEDRKMFWGAKSKEDFEKELGGYYYLSVIDEITGNVDNE